VTRLPKIVALGSYTVRPGYDTYWRGVRSKGRTLVRAFFAVSKPVSSEVTP
jgi:hypothetical protein